MSLPIFQRTVADAQGNIVPNALIEVRRESDNGIALIYADRAGVDPLGNPFLTGSDGFAQFFASPGEYRITATFAGQQIEWRFVVFSGVEDGSEFVNLTDNQTIAGAKTFSSPIVGSTTTQVSVTGDQTIAGVKTFSSPINGSGAGLTALPAAQLSGNVAAARITNALNASGSAPIYACRAWVNFNGTGTVAVRASGNVSSITDNGTGDYTVNFTTAMPDANYSAVVTGENALGATRNGPAPVNYHTYAAASLRILTGDPAGASLDFGVVNIAIFR
jgi:hypothetical protein